MGSGKILLVGDYGHVGTALARTLVARYPGLLIIAGRSTEEAEALAATLPDRADAARVEVRDEESVPQAVRHAQLLVNCNVDQRTPTLLRAACTERSVYLNSGANAAAIAGMLECSTEAVQHGTSALVAAGLDPG